MEYARETGLPNLEPGPSALRWLLGDDAADIRNVVSKQPS